MGKRLISISLAAVLLAQTAFTYQGGAPKWPLDFDVYDSWKSIAGVDLSRDGEWLSFTVNPQVGDGELVLKRSSGADEQKIARGSAARFTTDSKYYVYTIVPAKADVDKARKEKKAPKDQPKNNLAIRSLADGKTTVIERVRIARWPAKDSGWFAYQVEEAPMPPAAPAATPPKPPTDSVSEDGDQGAPVQVAPAKGQEPKPEQKQDDKPKKKTGHAVGSEWIVRRIADGKEFKVADVADLNFTEDGKSLFYSVSTKTGDGDGVFWMDVESQKTTPIATGMGQYRSIVLNKDTGMIAFLTDRDRYTKDPAEWAIHTWKPGDKASKEIVADGASGIGKDWVIVNRGQFNFSPNGKRLFFETGPKPESAPKPADPDEEKAVLDVWSWNDPLIQPVQLLRAAAERNKSYSAFVDVASGKVTQIEDVLLDSVTIGARGNGRYGLAGNDGPYSIASSWTGGATDWYIVDLQNGVRRRFLIQADVNPTITVDGKYAIWYDTKADDWMSIDLASGGVRNFTESIPLPLYDREHDTPNPRGPAGGAIAVKDGRVLISDSNDLWVCDPSGARAPRNVTDGVGELRGWRFSPVPFPSEDSEPGIDPGAQIWFSVVDQTTMDTGFFVDSIDGDAFPKQIVRDARRFTFAAKAEDANKIAFTRQTFQEYPNVWTTNFNFESPVKMSDANPQQANYIWGSAERVSWTSADGVQLQGVLVKPENFDPTKKYPMIVYFYERLLDNLHTHRVPSPSASTINPTEYASNGYLVFMPDIPYVEGYPGESAERAILPGVTMLVDRGYVKRDGIGIQGQSWGGYQVMHLVTRTNMFRAAGAGAAVSNMTSAYDGIREGSGLVRQFQYEMGQSRIAGSIWEYPLRYIENSPLFWADKVTTPVLMMNNDKDDAVPFSQGVEMYNALRRNGKKVWMLNYNGDVHNLMKRANRKDLSVRLMQFFNHYLKGDPAPKWMIEGVPAINKGKDFGLEIPGVKKP